MMLYPGQQLHLQLPERADCIHHSGPDAGTLPHDVIRLGEMLHLHRHALLHCRHSL